jgi:hypothetical protein
VHLGEYGELPGGADSRFEDSEEEQGQELIIYPFGLPRAVDVPIRRKYSQSDVAWKAWERWENELFAKLESELDLSGSYVPYITPVYWMTRSEPQQIEVEYEPVILETWTDIGLGYYAIPIEALLLMVEHFESAFGIKTGKRSRGVATPGGSGER